MEKYALFRLYFEILQNTSTNPMPCHVQDHNPKEINYQK